MFKNDYSDLCAPEVLKKLASLQKEQNSGYGTDKHTEAAKKKISRRFALGKNAEIHFLAGGTGTNMTVISYFLRPYEAVICADTGHINVHETGAVEGSGHKVLTVKNEAGKITPEGIRSVLALHTDEHMVKPRMVYLSDTTETGTFYKKAELAAIKAVCEEKGLLLFLDGARLGVALALPENDILPEDLPKLTDIFYIGGTKNGALYGEALVICEGKKTAPDFRFHIKNRGGMLAKGFAVGAQFEALFTNDLYFRLAENTVKTARLLTKGLQDLGVIFDSAPVSNQLFITLPKALAATLTERYGCELWRDGGENLTVRIVTSFATTEAACEAFLADMKGLLA